MAQAAVHLLTSLPLPLVITDDEHRTLFFNHAFHRLFSPTLELTPEGKSLDEYLLSNPLPRPREIPDLSDELSLHPLTQEGTFLQPHGGRIPVQRMTETINLKGKSLTITLLFDLTSHRALENQLLHNTYYDRMTGLPNRNLFNIYIKKEIQKLNSPEGYSFSVLLINMDRFKLVNENFGPNNADKVFLEIIERARTILQGFSDIFRPGGDELIAVLRGMDSRTYIESVFNRLQKLISIPILADGKSLFPSASFAVLTDISPQATPMQILSLLSDTMKQAKQKGLGSTVFKSMQAEVSSPAKDRKKDVLTLAAEIQNSLILSRFVPYFQPIYDTRTMALLGFEVLTRWNHPERGVLTPGEFLPAAEESGHIRALDRAVMLKSIQAMEEMSQKFPSFPFTLSVNASGYSLDDPSFIPFVETELKKAHFDKRRLAVEITENILIKDLNETSRQLENLKKLGIALYLDDFGTGYSSLQYLSQLPIDLIKIDKTFIDRLFVSEKNAHLVKTIIDMAQTLKVAVIAEGIETEDQNHWLSEFGVRGQGEYFSRPIPQEKAEEFIQDAAAFRNLLKP